MIIRPPLTPPSRAHRFFSQQAIPQRPKRHWNILRLNNDKMYYQHNIVSYKDTKLDFDHRLEPVCVLLNTCINKAALIDDFIISRHNNTVDPGNKCNVVSITAAARSAVLKQFTQIFRDEAGNIDALTTFRDDFRARLGITTTIDTPEDQKLIAGFLRAIERMAPFSVEQHTAFKELCLPEFKMTPNLQSFPEDRQYDPPYFLNSGGTLQMSAYHGTYQEDDHVIQKELPAIHSVILDDDLAAIQKRLAANPYEVNFKDPWGIRAHELASYVASHDIYNHMLAVRKTLIPKSMGEFDRLKHETVVMNVFSTNDDEPAYWQRNAQRIKSNRAEYDKVRALPIPVRSDLHLACIAGTIDLVQKTLKEEPNRLNEQDPRGYTPLLLAAANGHADLTDWLLEQKASLKDVWFTDPLYENPNTARLIGRCINVSIGRENAVMLRLIDNAATPEVMLRLLRYRVDPHVLNNRLEIAIYQNDINMATYLSHYLKHYPKFMGLTALDLSLRYANKFGTKMTASLLRASDEPLPPGPYDTDLVADLRARKVDESLFKANSAFYDISQEVAQLFAEHNKRYAARQKRKAERAILRSEQNHGDVFVSEFIAKNTPIISVIKPFSKIDPAEMAEIQRIFFANFTLVDNSTADAEQKFIKNELTQRKDIPAFVNLFYANEKLIGFLCYEVITAPNNKYIVFHGRLGAMDPDPAVRSLTHGLLAIAFRAMLAVKKLYPNKPVHTYAESIYPGFGLLAALPPDIDSFPKFVKPIEFIREVVHLTGETLVGNVIHTKLKVKECVVPEDNQTLNLFLVLTGGKVELAMPLCYDIDEKTETAYFNNMQGHGLEKEQLDLMQEYFNAWEIGESLRLQARM